MTGQLLSPGQRTGAAIPALLVCGLATASAFGQAGQVRTEAVPSEADGRAIHLTYFPAVPKSGGTENAPVVILLHGKGGDRLVWEQKGAGSTGKSFAAVLQDQGYAVVSVDLRKHGESKLEDDKELRPDDYRAMLGDLEAVKNFLLTEHQEKKLNINKTAIIAADDMAPVAVTFAQIDWQKKPYDDAPVTDPGARTPRGQDIRALVLLSPSQTGGSLNVLGPLRMLRNPRIGIAMQVIYGSQDSDDKGVSRRVYQNMAGIPQNKDRIEIKDFPVKFRGTDLTAKSILIEVPVLQFLDKHLLQLESEWRDRRSRLNR
jgi:pimeloyl-ACP methyl ester carboxylesterase